MGKHVWSVLLLVVILALSGAIAQVTSAATLTGSKLITIERSDIGEMYAAATVVLDLAVTQALAAVVIHDQIATWGIGTESRYGQWDVSGVWRPSAAWSVSVGRRWRVDAPPDYGVPWTYVQVWGEL